MVVISQLRSVLFDADLCNRHGSLRLDLVRRRYGLHNEDLGSYVDKDGTIHVIRAKVQTRPLTLDVLSELTSLYTTWRDTIEMLPIRYTYLEDCYYSYKDTPVSAEKMRDFKLNSGFDAYSKGDTLYFQKEVSEWALKQTIKRGNAPYVKLVKKKINPLLEREPLYFFSTELNSSRKVNRYTNLLYITGTVDPKKFDGIASAWLHFGSYWNSFITNIRRMFSWVQCNKCTKKFQRSLVKVKRDGRKTIKECPHCGSQDLTPLNNGCEYMRAWQSQKNGYPHFHALVYIPFDFSVVPWWEDNKRLTWRLSSRQKLQRNDKQTVRQRLKKAWKCGSLDIIAVSDVANSFKDMLKYITRDLEGGESDLTNTMVWFFGKQSYSVTRNFEQSLWGTSNIDWQEPSDDDLIYPQSSNSNLVLIRIEVFPIIPRQNLDFSYTKDILNLNFSPDPPPKVVEFLESYAFDCVPSSSRKGEDGIDIIVYRSRD